MGTDIHGFVQRRYNENERYETVGEIENGRNYVVFAILAGVRNGFGFAGCATHDPLTPVSAPRGLPVDLGWKDRWERTEFDLDSFDFGDHSQSWLTLHEILEWPHWDDKLAQVGYVDCSEYERMVAEGRAEPNSWCGGISGGRVVRTTQEEVEAGTAPEGWTHVHCAWETPLRNRVLTFRLWLEYLEAKYEWLIEKDPTAVRLVFGFDS